MDRFFGFDLGDAESAIARLFKEDQVTPEMLTVAGEQSFITAYAQLASGELLIGEKACYTDNAIKRKLRFKSRFLTDRSSANDVKSFAAGVLGELYGSGDLIRTGTQENITGRFLSVPVIRLPKSFQSPELQW